MHELSPNALKGQTCSEQLAVLLLHVHHVPKGSESCRIPTKKISKHIRDLPEREQKCAKKKLL